jgi:hypothetical protein
VDSMGKDVIDAAIRLFTGNCVSVSLSCHFPCIDKVPGHALVRATSWEIIEIACDDGGQSRISGHEFENFVEVGESFRVIGPVIQMSIEEQE